ncbi:hypothetical protein Bravens_01836 [Brevibacterium ravenspurgense]|uniref:Uncharacterized protein n=1 Tax=Brevibacterium ravenspurgense TaxID=479117 RepID=A0A150H5B4_9MICO|nr:hypothetical protein [Brevibacterium ravenspurgense]KXZ57316.1 hypothetical protein Bravens_01836 [Brevibacterium ravenspurgense]
MTTSPKTRIFRAGIASALAVTLLVSGCTNGKTRSGSETTSQENTAKTAAPFVQDLDSDAPSPAPVGVDVSENPANTTLSADNIGISFEATDLTDPRWDPDAGNLDEVLAALGSPGLRFGGNQLDRGMFWTSSGERPPDGKIAVTPEDLNRVARTVEKVGASVTLGIPLGDYDPERGADMVAHAKKAFGAHLLAVSIGNEPNGFTADHREGLKIRDAAEWDEGAYLKQVKAYRSAIQQRVGDDVRLVGPGVAEGSWMTAFLDAGFDETAALSQHWYATYECTSDKVPGRGPEWENLVSPLVHDSAERLLSIGLDKAEAAEIPLWVEETGPTSCPGTNDTSRTHASALWTVDYVLHAAEMGVERMNMHSMLGACKGGAPMSVVCSAEGTGEDGDGEVLTQPNFQGLRLAEIGVGGTFHDVAVSGKEAYAYAVRTEGSFIVTIVNNADAAKYGSREVTVTVPEGFTAKRAAQIHAPSNAAQSKTRYRELAEFADSGSGVKTAEDGRLVIDIAPSTATTIEFVHG